MTEPRAWHTTHTRPTVLTCELLQQVSHPGVAAAGGAGQGGHPAGRRLEAGRAPAPGDGHHLLLRGSPRLESWSMSLNSMTRTFFTSLDLERAIILTKTNDKLLLTLKVENHPFSCQGSYDIILTRLTWLCFTMALLSSIRPDKWLAMSAEWIRLSASVLASSLKRKHTFSPLIDIISFDYIKNLKPITTKKSSVEWKAKQKVTLPCDGDESGDHAVQAEHRDQQQQLESAVSAQHRDTLRRLLSKCQSRILLL